MPVNEYVTSANAIQSLYITRQEVIDAISTIVPALSSFSTISFGVTPNPSFSTISMPSGGVIQGFAPIQTSNVVFASTTATGYAGKLQLGNIAANSLQALTVSETTATNTAPIKASAFVAQTGAVFGANSYLTLNATGINANPAAGGVNLPIISWNGQTGASANIALSNISTINGSPPNVNPTTYTTLTGTTINNSGVLTSPSVVGVSSLNALPISAYQNSNSQPWVSYAVTNTAASGVINFSPGTSYTPLTFTSCPFPTTAGREVTISIPISYQITTPPTAPVSLTIEAFLGGSLTNGTQVTAIVPVLPNTSGGRVTLCGVATTNGSQPTVNIQTTGSSNFAATFVQGAGTTPRQFFFQTLGF